MTNIICWIRGHDWKEKYDGKIPVYTQEQWIGPYKVVTKGKRSTTVKRKKGEHVDRIATMLFFHQCSRCLETVRELKVVAEYRE